MQRFKNILCVVNTDLKDNTALEHAVKMAESNQSSLSVIEVIDEVSFNEKLFKGTLSIKDFQEKIIDEHMNKLDALISPWAKKVEIKYKVITGISFLEIIREVLRNKYDLLFKTAEGGGILDRLFGSDDMHLLRKCPCPVWLVKQKAPKSYQKILATVDVDDIYPTNELNARQLLNNEILEIASSLALSESSELHMIHIWEAIGENIINVVFNDTPEKKIASYVEEVKQQYTDNLDQLVRRLSNNDGVLNHINYQRHLIKGYPRKEIPLYAEKIKADLVVMGTVARIGVSGLFMGNTAESILNQLNCSVLAVKPPGYVTPVTLD